MRHWLVAVASARPGVCVVSIFEALGLDVFDGIWEVVGIFLVIPIDEACRIPSEFFFWG